MTSRPSSDAAIQRDAKNAYEAGRTAVAADLKRFIAASESQWFSQHNGNEAGPDTLELWNGLRLHAGLGPIEVETLLTQAIDALMEDASKYVKVGDLGAAAKCAGRAETLADQLDSRNRERKANEGANKK